MSFLWKKRKKKRKKVYTLSLLGVEKVKTLRLATLAIHFPLNLRTAHLLINVMTLICRYIGEKAVGQEIN